MRRAPEGRVLTTDDVSGWNRAALATVRALAGTRFRPVVAVARPRSLAASSRWCDSTVVVPEGGTPGYDAALREVVATGGFAAVLPASDLALVALQDPAARLVDKAQLDDAVRAAGLDGLPGEVFAGIDELRAAAESLTYPVVAKSVVKSGVANLQAVRADTPAEIRALSAAPGPVIVQPFVDKPLRAVSGVVWDDRYLALCHQEYQRLWPPRAGVSSAAMTVPPDHHLEERLLPLLAGHRGVFQVQLLGDHVLDVNPRVYGSMPLAVAAGANLPLLACEAAGGSVRDDVVRARPDVRYRWLEGDLRHLAAAARGRDLPVRDAVRAAWPRRRTAYSVESLRDPRPALLRLRGALAGRRGAGDRSTS